MLSRVADSLYWLGRYVERAENLARIVEVTRREDLESFRHDPSDSLWKPVLFATCVQEEDKELETPDDPAHFITLDRKNPASIANCIAGARENARVVRDQISEEMWLELNSIHLFLRSDAAERSFHDDPDGLFRRIIRFSIIFQGLTQSTILQDEGWHFSRLGKFIERADKTSRILDTLTFRTGEPSAMALLAVLRSCSGFTAFRSEYRDDNSFRNVASFLFFSVNFPRSIRFCLRRINEALLEISGTSDGFFTNEAERLTGRTLAQINFTDVDQLFKAGLHQSVDELQQNLNDIGQCIFENYVLLPSELRDVVRTEGLQHSLLQQHRQKQQ